jgi:hypothetical protein
MYWQYALPANNGGSLRDAASHRVPLLDEPFEETQGMRFLNRTEVSDIQHVGRPIGPWEFLLFNIPIVDDHCSRTGVYQIWGCRRGEG